MMDAMATYQVMHQAFNSRDAEKVVSCLSEDYVLESVPSGMSIKGREAAKAHFDGAFQTFRDLRFETKSAFASGNKFAVEYVMSGTQKKEFHGMPATGKSFTVRCCSILEFEGGLFTRETMYFDATTMMRQLGHIPSPT
jgi:steroid delta-isomerase-like uncharacterized protein